MNIKYFVQRVAHTPFEQQKDKSSARACNYPTSSGNLFFLEHSSSGKSGITEANCSFATALPGLRFDANKAALGADELSALHLALEFLGASKLLPWKLGKIYNSGV